MKKFELVGTKILVRRSKKVEETTDGLLIPEAVQKAPASGVVEATGPGILDKNTGKYWPLKVKKGDLILFNQYAGQFVEVDQTLKSEVDLIVLDDEDEVLSIVREE